MTKVVKSAGVFFLLTMLYTSGFAVTQPKEDEKRSDPAAVEAQINALKSYDDTPSIVWIQNSIMGQKPQEQARLLKLFNDKLNQFKEEGKAGSSQGQEQALPAQQAVQDLSLEEYQARIEELDLSSSASVEEIRKRDKLVEEISGIQDPDLRYNVLEYLQNKEREMGGR